MDYRLYRTKFAHTSGEPDFCKRICTSYFKNINYMNRIILLIGFCQFILIHASVLKAQNDITEEWEMEYLKRQPPEKILTATGVKKGMVIGEIGAGRGRFTVYMAREVGPSGKIYANDIDEKALAYLKGRAVRQGFKNIESITGRQDDPRFLDNSLDMAVMVLVYHMLGNPDNLLKNIKSGLKPGANLVIIDPVDRLIDEEFGVDRSNPGEHPPKIKERIKKSARVTGYEISRIDTFLKDDIIFILKPTDREKRISGAEVIRDKIIQSGSEEGLKLFELIKTDSLHYNLAEGTFLNIGYEFYGRRTLPEAIACLTMGISIYPKSEGLYFSLGEMYLIHGDKEKSRENFKLSLEFNPDNKSAQYVLKNLDEIFDQTHPKKK
jgi:SAM-dependent methyltransferase